MATAERRRRIRRKRRKNMIAILILLLLFAAVASAIIATINWTVGLVRVAEFRRNASQTPVTTTTTKPTLNAETVTPTLHTPGACILYDATHDNVLYELNANETVFPASITKLLTAAIACEYTKADSTFTLGSEQTYVAWDASTAYLENEKTYSRSALLDALLLPSGADAAYCLAANTAKIHEENPEMTDLEALNIFVGYMNEKAKELGCTNTNFVTPDGYHNANHYTTAKDLLKIAQYAYSIPDVKASFKKSSSDLGDWRNGNLLLSKDSSCYYQYANGMKTGTTDEAGYCLAACAEKNGTLLYAILLNVGTYAETVDGEVVYNYDQETYRFTDASTLFELGFDLIEHPPTTTTTFHDYFDCFETIPTKK